MIGQTISRFEAERLAAKIAALGFGSVSPNPPVGCVIVSKDQKLLGHGYHKKFGGPHAEIEAMKGINPKDLEGSTFFVTLEPCSHLDKKTPPCAQALAKLRIAEVCYGSVDPNPKVQGKGIQLLKEQGKTVSEFTFAKDDCESLIEVFAFNQRHKKTFVAIKIGSSLDGVVALKDGSSQWITSEKSRQHAQLFRAKYDAVLVGANTFLQDDPSLNVRLESYLQLQNRVVVLGGGEAVAKAFQSSNLLKYREANKIYWVTSSETTSAIPSEINHIYMQKNSQGKFELHSLMQKFYDLNIFSLLVEGGGGVISSFLKEKIAHRLHLYLAPKILGQGGGVAWTSKFSIQELNQGLKLSQKKVFDAGDDFYITGLLPRD